MSAPCRDSVSGQDGRTRTSPLLSFLAYYVDMCGCRFVYTFGFLCELCLVLCVVELN